MSVSKVVRSRLDPFGTSIIKDYEYLYEDFGIEQFKNILHKIAEPLATMRRGVIFGHRDFDRILNAINNHEKFAVMSGIKPSGEFHYEWSSQEGVTIERDELDFKEIIRRGENIKTEFKINLKNTIRFLETVVAFTNTIGGLIFLGVADDTRIIGFDAKSEEQISKLISSNIDPIPRFDVRQINIDEHKITIVELPEGDDKPYSHRQLGVYVRSGSTNRHATRTDLDAIYEERSKEIPR